jgi:hypothetical protein
MGVNGEQAARIGFTALKGTVECGTSPRRRRCGIPSTSLCCCLAEKTVKARWPLPVMGAAID